MKGTIREQEMRNSAVFIPKRKAIIGDTLVAKMALDLKENWQK